MLQSEMKVLLAFQLVFAGAVDEKLGDWRRLRLEHVRGKVWAELAEVSCREEGEEEARRGEKMMWKQSFPCEQAGRSERSCRPGREFEM